nr:immunoglobulin heavy chain junction region [Mus musculus]
CARQNYYGSNYGYFDVW